MESGGDCMIEVNIQKSCGDFQLDVSFSAGNGVLALLGGSGSGKSMTLRAIAGIVAPDRGRIVVDDTVFFDSEKKINLPPQRRQVGLLFQNYALFPTMTVLDNIITGVRTGSKREKLQIAQEALERFALHGLGGRYPQALSGGQQQRAALARILVGNPRILMLDEPFSALDSHLRDQMERETLDLIHSFGGTTLLVSHSRDEVFRMADQIAVYDGGHIDALGEKHALFQNPGTYRAALLTGCKNFSVVSSLRKEAGITRFHADDWDMDLTVPEYASGTVAGIRGHHIKAASTPGPNTFEMEITDVIEDTFEYMLLLRRSGTQAAPLQWMVDKDTYRTLPKHTLLVHIPPAALMLLRNETA